MKIEDQQKNISSIFNKLLDTLSGEKALDCYIALKSLSMYYNKILVEKTPMKDEAFTLINKGIKENLDLLIKDLQKRTTLSK